MQKEIISSGGMHSLLTLFKSCGGNNSNNHDVEVKKVVALTVSYLVPSCSDGTSDVDTISKFSHEIKIDFELKLLECFKFLILDIKDCKETRKCAASALTYRWINVIQPKLHNSIAYGENNSGAWSSVLLHGPSRLNDAFKDLTSGRGRECRQEKRRQLLQMQLVIQQAVMLVLTLANLEVFECIPLIDTMCAAEPLRPILAQGGVIKILVRWLSSKNDELISSASNALMALTSPCSQYMAGWIHSQILYEGAISVVIELSSSVQRDVRLSVAEILANLTVAPLTRDAIVKLGGPTYLVKLLMNERHDIQNDSWDEKLGLAAGSALLRLVTFLPTQFSSAMYHSTNTGVNESNNLIW